MAFAIFPKSTAFIQPAKGAFNNPAFWKDLELVQFAAFDDLNICTDGIFDTIGKRLARITAIAKNADHMSQRR